VTATDFEYNILWEVSAPVRIRARGSGGGADPTGEIADRPGGKSLYGPEEDDEERFPRGEGGDYSSGCPEISIPGSCDSHGGD